MPQISVVLGPCAGGAVYSPAMTDFIFMVRESSHMFITGPDVVRTVTGEDVTLEELGGAMSHATKSGVATFVAADEKACLEDVRYLLSFLPSNNLEDPPAFESGDDPERLCPSLVDLMPDTANKPYDMKKVITTVVDDGEFFEYFPHWAGSIVCGFARLDGHPVGIVGNQPMVLAGVLDIDSSEKAARFVRTCDAFNIPIVTFVDVPGLPARRRPGVRRHHPPRRQAALRLLRGDRAPHPGHHPQGLRRRVRGHELEVDRRGPRVRVAERGARGDGTAGSGRDLVPPRAAAGRRSRRPDEPSSSPSTPRSTRTRTARPSAATSTTSSIRPRHE